MIVLLIVPPLSVAEIVTSVGVLTAPPVIEKMPEVPGPTRSLADTLAADGLLLEIVTSIPPLGGFPLRVTTASIELPTVTLVGKVPHPFGCSGATVRAVDTVEPPALALMVTGDVVDTREVKAEKLAELLPAGIVTDTGTVTTDVSSLRNVTRTPPVGAAPVKYTRPETELPPTGDPANSTFARAYGTTVRSVERVCPPPETDIFTIVSAATVPVVEEMIRMSLPAGMV